MVLPECTRCSACLRRGYFISLYVFVFGHLEATPVCLLLAQIGLTALVVSCVRRRVGLLVPDVKFIVFMAAGFNSTAPIPYWILGTAGRLEEGG